MAQTVPDHTTDVDAHTPATLPDADAVEEDRARRAREESMVVVPITNDDNTATGLYHVTSQSGSTYLVDLDGGRCGCPDNRHRESLCKHLRRVAIMVTDTRLPSPGDAAAPYVQWTITEHLHAYKQMVESPGRAPDWAAHHYDVLQQVYRRWTADRTVEHPESPFPSFE